MKIQLVNFVVQGLCFSMKLLGFTSKAIKVLLTELIGQRRIYCLFRIDRPNGGQYGNGCGKH